MSSRENHSYLVPAGYGEALLVEKRSKFTARIWLVADEQEALTRIAEMKKQYWDAAHNVHAYIIKDGPVRYSDDGEPTGTSGQPTLKVLQARQVFNVCCVVTRYFGGVLLGAGGLVRAYSAAAGMALDNSGVSLMRLWDQVLVACPYPLFEPVRNQIAASGGSLLSSDYGVDVMLDALIPVENAESFAEALRELSAGQVDAEKTGTVFRAARPE